MDFTTFSICVASLQALAVHVMTPEQFNKFLDSLKAMRDAGETPRYIVSSLNGQINDIVRTQEWQKATR